jgi:hypothetical protein
MKECAAGTQNKNVIATWNCVSLVIRQVYYTLHDFTCVADSKAKLLGVFTT